MKKVHGIRSYFGNSEKPASETCNDIQRLFDGMAGHFKQYGFTDEFGINYNDDPRKVAVGLYGAHLLEVCDKSQVALISGERFRKWMAESNVYEGFFHMVVRLEEEREGWTDDIYHSLNTRTWPSWLVAVIHMWDDSYWEFYSREKALVDGFFELHRLNQSLDLFRVELDLDFPDPRNTTLERYT